jgi:hypothetical protein
MSKGSRATTHAVIDGSNLATEGRSEPSLAQLDEAVQAIADEYDFGQITVIVDATFEHRVAKAETKAARTAIDDGRILTPPAGVIGRGDAFILQVADRANAVVFSNDSFQEFHGVYKWLFDEGRLIGGKPVPAIGWIYVARSPVRGPVSRRATAESRRPPAKTKATPQKSTAKKSTPAPVEEKKPARSRAKATPKGEGSNDASVWTTFKSDFPVGSTIAATVDRFSSHGAYGSVDDVVIYLPNRLLGIPAPTKARDVIDLGATVDFVIHRYDDERSGIDAGLIPAPGASKTAATPRKRTAAKKQAPRRSPAKKAARRVPMAKKVGGRVPMAKKVAGRVPMAKKAVAKRPAAKKTAVKKTAAKKTAARPSAAKKTPAKRATAKKAAAPRRSAPKKAVAKKTAKKATKRR